MAKDGKIALTHRQINKRIGAIFVERASINLHSDILDHPDFFWEDDEYLAVYLRVAKYLEVERRVEVLNKRLDIIKELFDMLASELNNRSGLHVTSDARDLIAMSTWPDMPTSASSMTRRRKRHNVSTSRRSAASSSIASSSSSWSSSSSMRSVK